MVDVGLYLCKVSGHQTDQVKKVANMWKIALPAPPPPPPPPPHLPPYYLLPAP